MKKLITALLCVCILLGVYGCAAKPATEDPAAQAKPTQTEQTPAADAQTLETSVQDETVDPFGGYDTPITLTTIVAQTLTTSCPEGVTLDDELRAIIEKDKRELQGDFCRATPICRWPCHRRSDCGSGHMPRAWWTTCT